MKLVLTHFIPKIGNSAMCYQVFKHSDLIISHP